MTNTAPLTEKELIDYIVQNSSNFVLPSEYARLKNVDRQLVNYWIKTNVIISYEIPKWKIRLIPLSEENEKNIAAIKNKKVQGLFQSMTPEELEESVKLLEQIRKQGKNKKL